jgi:hypothetical protein
LEGGDTSMEKKSLVEQRLEEAEKIPNLKEKITERNEPNLKLMAQAMYDHINDIYK